MDDGPLSIQISFHGFARWTSNAKKSGGRNLEDGGRLEEVEASKEKSLKRDQVVATCAKMQLCKFEILNMVDPG